MTLDDTPDEPRTKAKKKIESGTVSDGDEPTSTLIISPKIDEQRLLIAKRKIEPKIREEITYADRERTAAAQRRTEELERKVYAEFMAERNKRQKVAVAVAEVADESIDDEERQAKDEERRLQEEKRIREEKRAKEAEEKRARDEEKRAREEDRRAREEEKRIREEKRARDEEKRAKEAEERRAREAEERRAREAEEKRAREEDKRAREEEKRIREEKRAREEEKRAKEAEERRAREEEKRAREAEERRRKLEDQRNAEEQKKRAEKERVDIIKKQAKKLIDELATPTPPKKVHEVLSINPPSPRRSAGENAAKKDELGDTSIKNFPDTSIKNVDASTKNADDSSKRFIDKDKKPEVVRASSMPRRTSPTGRRRKHRAADRTDDSDREN
uniref:Uncharacterized protein n=1 Tax=Panagrolaimus sp. JU765 TaxID=591449 RepID=A0AC34QCD8_9BILA